MNHHQNALEALAQLSHVAGLIDTAECKDEGLYNRLQSALAVSNAALDDAMKALAAAPQVVADERATALWNSLHEVMEWYAVHGNLHHTTIMCNARAALAAAPVQAQEPVEYSRNLNCAIKNLKTIADLGASSDFKYLAKETLKCVSAALEAIPSTGQETLVWWDKSVGGFYMSKRTIPASVIHRGGLVELIAKPIAPVQPVAVPIDMVLHCPACGLQHIDAPDGEWTNPPHRSHLCHGCNYVWRPADVLTNGVAFVSTSGSKDRPIAAPAAQGDAKDAERLEFIENGTFDLRCYNDHDFDIYWNVIEHHMAEPNEREIGWGNTARQAIDAAIAAKAAS